jgi:hypothetical protein
MTDVASQRHYNLFIPFQFQHSREAFDMLLIIPDWKWLKETEHCSSIYTTVVQLDVWVAFNDAFRFES